MSAPVMETIRTFRTANFQVVVDALYTDEPPDLSWDESGEAAKQLADGTLSAFTVRVRVIHATLGEVAVEYLSGGIYASPAEFQDHRECGKANRELAAKGDVSRCWSYFADMIAEACADARKAIRKAQSIYVRPRLPA